MVPLIYDNILDAIGRTPLVKLNKLVAPEDATVYAKLEFLNPGGSIKDRMAVHMIDKAEETGQLKPGGTIVENTSGNTGFGLAMVAAARGYKCIFTMPDKMSLEKVNRLKAMGAQVIVTPTNVSADDPRSYYETAKRLAKETPGSFYPNQYHNLNNVEAHYLSTGPEIWQQLDGKLDYFVAGLGTGGTMSGAGKFFKERNPKVQNVGVDPIGSVYAGYFATGKIDEGQVYKVEGIGEEMLCAAMNFQVVDSICQVNDSQAFLTARKLAREEGIFSGGSSGAAVFAAIELAKKVGSGATIVVILPDSGNSYISKFYADEWMRDHGFLEPKYSGSVLDILAKKKQSLIAASRGETIEQVISDMRKYGISQMPVLAADGIAVGMIHEYDMLSVLIEGTIKPSDSIDSFIAPIQGLVTPQTTVSQLRQVFSADNVAVVQDGEKITGIVTKIDLIEYLAGI